jgi:hypothetical protein
MRGSGTSVQPLASAEIRARAGISFALTEALDDGHCGLPRDELLPMAVKLLEIPDAIIIDALRLELESGAVIADSVGPRQCVFLAGLHRAEQSIAGRLKVLGNGYATTIHKSQGSEYPVVVIPILTQHYAMLQRNLLYTGVTRGKRLVILLGQKKAVAMAVKNSAGRRRWSKLLDRITDEQRRPR